MNNIIATVPKSRFKTWKGAERNMRKSDGEKFFWTICMPRVPKKEVIGSLCYMVWGGQVRGYFDIVDVDLATNWSFHKKKNQTGYVFVLANWHPVNNLPEMTGFQGWRYTALRP